MTEKTKLKHIFKEIFQTKKITSYFKKEKWLNLNLFVLSMNTTFICICIDSMVLHLQTNKLARCLGGTKSTWNQTKKHRLIVARYQVSLKKEPYGARKVLKTQISVTAWIYANTDVLTHDFHLIPCRLCIVLYISYKFSRSDS